MGFRRSYGNKKRYNNSDQLKMYSSLRHDTMLFSAAANPKSLKMAGPVRLTENSYCPLMNLWCPSARHRTTSFVRGLRQSSDVLFVGVREVLTIGLATPDTVTVRRVVFLARDDHESSESFAGPSTTLLRNMAFDPVTSDAGEALVSELFSGTNGVDYNSTTVMRHRLDSGCQVLSDKTYTSPVGRTSWSLKFWHPVRRKLMYDENESGVGTTTSVWAGHNTGSAGNVYVLTLVETGGSMEGPAVSCNTDVYWREKV